MQRIISGGYTTRNAYYDNVPYQFYDAYFFYKEDLKLKIWHEYDNVIDDAVGGNVQFGDRIIEDTGMYLYLDGTWQPTPQIIYGRGDRNGENKSESYAGDFIDKTIPVKTYGPRGANEQVYLANDNIYSPKEQAIVNKSPYKNPYKGNTPQERKCWLYDSIEYFDFSLKNKSKELEESLTVYQKVNGKNATTSAAIATVASVANQIDPIIGPIVSVFGGLFSFQQKKQNLSSEEKIKESTEELNKEIVDYKQLKAELVELEKKYGKGCGTSNDPGGNTKKLTTAQIIVIILVIIIIIVLFWRFYSR